MLADFVITGLPAILIILVILALLDTGAFVTLRAAGRGAKKAVDLRDHQPRQ